MERSIGIIGRGRVGTSLALAWKRGGAKVAFVRSARAPHPGEILVLAVPDRAVSSVAAELARHDPRPAVVAHVSGSLGLDALSALSRAGTHLGSLHPLLAVPRPRTDLAGAWAAVDGDLVARRALGHLAHLAGMRTFRRPPKDRVRYHLGATLAANSLAPLLGQTTDLLVESGLTPREANAALIRLMASALLGVAQRGPVEGLTGPVARGDEETVERHLRALGSRRSITDGLYRALGLAAVDLARQRKPAPPALERIARRLRHHGP